MSPTNYQYSYLIGVLVFCVVWLVLFLKRKTFRKEMLYLGVLGMFFGPIANYFWYTRDWWNPPNILGLRVGIEDFLMGFTNIGIVAVIYEEFARKTYDRDIPLSKDTVFDRGVIFRLVLFLIVGLTPMLVTFYLFKWHSFWANLLGLFIGGTYILLIRRDLWKDSIFTALLVPIITMPAFWLPEVVTPGWIANFWMLSNLSGLTLLKIPLEDLIWYSFSGFCLGSFYEYLFKLKCTT